jgi:hypothetical protein
MDVREESFDEKLMTFGIAWQFHSPLMMGREAAIIF